MSQDRRDDRNEQAESPTRTESGEAATEGMPAGLLSPGQVLGERYQILEALGRGGMGEVWRAFDLKLRAEVALKALRMDLFRDEKRLEMLRSEVRAAREVVSPNVCRIFDLIEVDGTELVSMEYVDGQTLLAVLQDRGPLELKEAQDIASQFLAGLEAIHKAGLVHRDVKPENIMVTRAGRVVVMDFGLARQEASGAGTVAGTPAYMAPEQAAGMQVDARADVYSAGVVLAEMVSPDGIRDFSSRQSLWEGVRSEPAKVPETPWAPVLRKAVAKEREQRYNSAHTLTRALEDVTLRVEGAEDLHPYPGLASFTEEDAEYFFGREAEVEQMWRKLERPHMLALIGPSGAGKSSLIRAGLLAAAPPDWSCLVCTPGDVPVLSVGRALARAMAGDQEIVEQMLSFDDPDVAIDVVSRWRHRAGNGLLVVDQFEELFTQNSPEVQRRFADLLGRLAIEADVHVLVSMRDDFLFRCSDQPALAPVFSELTPLRPPSGSALRRAVTQPAMKCGYRFEDDELVEEMLAEVEGERGALPLLAFAAARLWEKRDRENGMLTRQAYHDIGGVGGALARHAEETIDRIGANHVPIVRELFRNLVTAEGTRAVREWDELLSVFDTTLSSRASDGPEGRRESRDPPTNERRGDLDAVLGTPGDPSTRSLRSLAQDDERSAAEEVLHELINARLLTSYEVHEEDREPTRRVEIIHESLLANWPRLVRWQTQDADAAQLRDQLRQAAKTWDEHGRSDDLLWTGTAYREFRLWRERYPGGLTEVEESFAAAMTSLATRRRRRRRLAAAAALIVFALVAVVFGALWRRSVLENRRAEAQKLIALGQIRLEDYPTAALAHATASLALADSEEARFLALEALWEGPTAFVVNDDSSFLARFSPNGNWLVQAIEFSNRMNIISRDGGQRHLEHPTHSKKTRIVPWFGALDDLFLTEGSITDAGRIALWSAPQARVLASARPMDDCDWFTAAIGEQGKDLGALIVMWKNDLFSVDALRDDGTHEHLSSFRMAAEAPGTGSSIPPYRICVPRRSGAWIGAVDGGEVSVIDVGEHGLSRPRVLGRHEEGVARWCHADPFGRFILTFDLSGGIKLWDPTGRREPATARYSGTFRWSELSGSGSHCIVFTEAQNKRWDASIWGIDEHGIHLRRQSEGIESGWPLLDSAGLQLAMVGPRPAYRLWSLGDPAGAEPLVLRRGPAAYAQQLEFTPDGRWLATPDHSGLLMWPLARQYPSVIRSDLDYWISGIAFDTEGRFLAFSADDTVSVVPLQPPIPPPDGVAVKVGVGLLQCLAVSPDGNRFAVGEDAGELWVGTIDGRELVLVGDRTDWGHGTFLAAFSPHGRYLAFMTGGYDKTSAVTRVWDLESKTEVATLHLPGEEVRSGLRFSNDGRLLTASTRGVVAWDTNTSEHQLLVESRVATFTASSDGRRILYSEEGEAGLSQDPAGSPIFVDLDAGEQAALTRHGSRVVSMALDRAGTVVVTGDRDGIIRVGPVTGEEPHLLLGHDSEIIGLEVDPLGRWVASAGLDKTVRLWPMPDLSKPPLHTLPREELIVKLKTLTNVRVVRDEESATGWKLSHDPFPGWETVPTW